MRPSIRISIWFLFCFLSLLVFSTSTFAAGTLTPTPSTIAFCSTAGYVPQTISVAGSGATLGALSASSDNGVFRVSVVGATQVTVELASAPTTNQTGTITISAAGFNNATVSVSYTFGGTCSGGGGGTGALTASPASVSMSSSAIGTATQAVTITSAAATNVSVSALALTGGNWLYVSPSSGTTPLQLNVSAYSGGTPGAGTYSGTITVTPVGGGTALTISVTYQVGSGSTSGNLSATPNPMTFNAAGSQYLTITDAAATSYTAYATQTSGPAGWLTINNSVSSAAGTLPTSVLTVGVNTTNLSVGTTYSGTITIFTQPDNQNLAVTVYATPGGSSNPSLQISPSSVSLSSPAGNTSLVSQLLTISSTTTGLTYTTQVSVATGSQWLSVSPAAGAIPSSNVLVYANPIGLAAGTYTGSIIFTTQGTTVAQQVVPVSFTVGGGGTTGQVAPSSLSFAYQAGAATGASSQSLLVNGAIGTTYSASVSLTSGTSSNWLSVSPSSGTFSTGTPTALTVSIINQTLPVGTYTASITITNSSGVTTVPVTLSVTSGQVLVSNPGSFTFQVPAGSSGPTSQTLILNTSTGSTPTGLSYTITPSVSWLSVTPAAAQTTPAYLSVVVNTAGLPSGFNVGTLSISALGAANNPLVIPVVVAIVGGVTITPNTLSFSAFPGGSSPPAQLLTLTASNATTFVASAYTSSGGNWLSVSPQTSTTPASLAVTASTTNLAIGTYTGTVAITSAGTTQNIPVTLTVSTTGQGGSLTVTPTTLTFNIPTGGGNPGIQGIQVTSASYGVSFTAAATTTTGGSWLSVSPTIAAVPVNLGISVNPAGLAAGTYQGTITLTPTGGSPQTVAVTMVVQAPATLTVSPSTMSFAYRTGDSPPASQSISVSSSGTALGFTASASSSGWLTVNPASGTTPGTVTVSINPSGLTPSTTPLTGTITIAGSGGNTTSQTVNVSLTVTGPLPTVSRVVNAASYTGTSIAPGEIVTLFGDSIGPATQATLTLDSTGKVATTLGGVQVLFNGLPAPMIFASSTQVSAVVPYGIAGRLSTFVQIQYQGVKSNAVTVPVSTTAPGIFTLNASGSGPGAILNEDGSVNTPTSGASAGSVVVLYVTGEGQTTPRGVDGSVATPPNLTTPILPVAVTIGGLPATVLYAGGAPGLVAGVMQVNVRIPAGVASGSAGVTITVGSSSSQSGVTLAVR